MRFRQEKTYVFSTVSEQERLQRLKIVVSDNHVLAAVVRVRLPVRIKAVPPLQHPIRHLLVVVDYFIFSDPFKGGMVIFPS